MRHTQEPEFADGNDQGQPLCASDIVFTASKEKHRGSVLRKYASPNPAMIYLSVYLILHFLSSIYLLTQCGGKKKNDQNKDKKGATPTPAPPAAPAKPAEEKSKPAAEEKKDEGKQEASKPADTKSAEKPKDDKKKEEAEKKEGEDKKQEELKLDPTPPSGDDEKKEPPKEPAASKSTMGKPDDQIKLSASSLVWEDKEAQQVLKVTNNSEKKQALKIKCSNNETFK
ncbi:hypothetical protein NECAME_08577 [Necator americanus]|uniref:MSP domain-containing protein n=1 Tax=Necator americanus TaxID=51031 RepID=W2TH00_NECAM|nr:hypothetical protein NECAME_08577 [Necator americanus]ETN81320.1 hypothetical protein NECAME_08577 [Necator americanus]